MPPLSTIIVSDADIAAAWALAQRYLSLASSFFEEGYSNREKSPGNPVENSIAK
jgi:hypothetical protein